MSDFNENNNNNTEQNNEQNAYSYTQQQTYTQNPNGYQPPNYTQQYQQQQPTYNSNPIPEYNNNYSNYNNYGTYTTTQYYLKSRIAAALLAFLFGVFGVHSFYLGNTGKGVAQLLITLLGSFLCGIGPIVSLIWAYHDGIQLFKDAVPTDGHGLPFVD